MSDIENIICKRLCDSIAIQKIRDSDFRINVPFFFGDGDMLKIILKQTQDGNFTLTDEARTFMYLSYHDIELRNSPAQLKMLNRILKLHDMEESNGRIIMNNVNIKDIGEAVFTFSQALLKVSDFTLWKREYVRSMFLEQFQEILPECTGGRKCEFNYHYRDLDPQGIYIIDCLIHGKKDIHVYAVNSETKAKNTAISMGFYSSKIDSLNSCAVFDNNSDITKKSRLQISDVAGKVIQSLSETCHELPKYLKAIDEAA